MNLSSASDPGKWDSFGETLDEFEYIKESAEPLISDDGVQGAERDESLLLDGSELHRLGLTLNEWRGEWAAAGGFLCVRCITRLL